MADNAKTGSASVVQIREAFARMAPMINHQLTEDALKSFGDFKSTVLQGAFVTTFNPKFDAQVSQAVPNSAGAKKARPQTASATVKLDDASCNALIRRLDRALLQHKMSPFDAFKAADVDKNGYVCVDELRNAIKRMLPGEEITAADLKLVMAAFDTNRNQRIEEDEFINALQLARETPPMSAAPQMNGYAGQNMLSSINQRESPVAMRAPPQR